VVAVYNGEIYNTTGYASDGKAIIPAYLSCGDTFAQTLDGEFAIVLVDFRKRQAIIATDQFRTKPLWYSLENGEFGFASYRSALERCGFTQIERVQPNSIFTLNLDTLEFSRLANVVNWDLVQHKENFSHWTHAFEQSIKKRTQNLREKIFIGLSSGYDSGTIACELNKQGVDYTAFTVMGKEPPHILEQRQTKNHYWIQPNQELVAEAHTWIWKNVENFRYTISSSSSDYNEYWLDLQNDGGSVGMSIICSQAKPLDCKILLSGSGADELFSDYGFRGHKIYPHSNFGGLFPDDLSSIFPWNSFYGSSMESYLAKEEYVAGSYGIETRYPFLDKHVVQEFLWLTADLKNSAYKSVLHNYLIENNYPFIPGQKLGFGV
jgi:asparagine synthetase B (glutamine-hydrolysing)